MISLYKNKKDDRGYVLAIALIAIVIMSFFLITGTSTTSSTIKVSGNYSKTVEGFNLAEVGIAKARPILEADTFDNLLTTYASTPLINTTNFNNQGTYQVTIYDNDDGDGNLLNDSDDIIIAKAVGTNNSGGTVTIEAHFQKPTATAPLNLPPESASGSSAALMCGTASDVKTSGTSSISGNDCIPPTLPCLSTAACAPVSCASGGYAILGESTLNISGSGYVSPLSPGYQQNVTDTGCSDWRTLRDQLAALPESDDVVYLTGTGVNSQLNDCTDPKIFVINTSSTSFLFSGNAMLCGIIVVASNTSIDTAGNTVIVGAVLVMGADATFQFTASTGTPRLYGRVILEAVGTDTTKELETKGTADLMFSSSGMGFATTALNDALGGGGGGGGGGLITMAWKETY